LSGAQVVLEAPALSSTSTAIPFGVNWLLDAQLLLNCLIEFLWIFL
jgi:hypothetical protein